MSLVFDSFYISYDEEEWMTTYLESHGMKAIVFYQMSPLKYIIKHNTSKLSRCNYSKYLTDTELFLVSSA